MSEAYDEGPDLDEAELGFKHDGSPTLAMLGNAVQVWSITNSAAAKDVTVGDAALAFMLPTSRIAEAVEWHYWMFLSGDGPLETRTIEHDGE